MNNGLIIVVSAPSGGGKGTILSRLFEADKNLQLSVSATTRNPRPGEEHGKQYYFISKDEFLQQIKDDMMLEYAEYAGNYYGTPKAPVEQGALAGRDIVLEIEVQGGAQIKKLVPQCVSIFIMPPSMGILENRLRKRGTEDGATVAKRLEIARQEIPCAKDYDYIVYNNRLEDAVEDIQAIIRAEKLKFSRNFDSIERVLQNA